MVFQVLESEGGAGMGTVEAPDVYAAARKASQQFFKEQALPYRETGWAGKSGTFAVQRQDGTRGRQFFVRVPS